MEGAAAATGLDVECGGRTLRDRVSWGVACVSGVNSEG